MNSLAWIEPAFAAEGRQQTASLVINGGMHFRPDCYQRPLFTAARTERAQRLLLRYVGR